MHTWTAMRAVATAGAPNAAVEAFAGEGCSTLRVRDYHPTSPHLGGLLVEPASLGATAVLTSARTVDSALVGGLDSGGVEARPVPDV